jgi:hypothetical protein
MRFCLDYRSCSGFFGKGNQDKKDTRRGIRPGKAALRKAGKMTKLELFNECLRGGYNNTPDYISWKIKDAVLYLQCSRQKEDWLKNLDSRPVRVVIGGICGEVCYIPKGFDDAMEGFIRAINGNYFSLIVGYSHGAAVGALLSGALKKPAVVFGCPHFVLPGRKVKNVFSHLEIYNNPFDIVAMLPPVYGSAGKVTILSGTAKKTGTWIEWNSHHSPNEYRQRLEGL